MCNRANTDKKALLTETERQQLKNVIASQGGVLKQSQVRALMQQHAVSFSDLLTPFLDIAATFAAPPISEFYVGAIAFGEQHDGVANLYFGANLEFANQALSLVVHAEQCAINNAWQHGEKALTGLAITDAPCGYCRQFINEVRGARTMPVTIAGKETTFENLLPEPFGPASLGNSSMLFDQTQTDIVFDTEIPEKLRTAMATAYAPYSKNQSACLIECQDGSEFVGRYAENAAYSPSLSPLQSALSQMMMHGQPADGSSIKRITLAEIAGIENQLNVAKAVLPALGEHIEFTHVTGRYQ